MSPDHAAALTETARIAITALAAGSVVWLLGAILRSLAAGHRP